MVALSHDFGGMFTQLTSKIGLGSPAAQSWSATDIRLIGALTLSVYPYLQAAAEDCIQRPHTKRAAIQHIPRPCLYQDLRR